MTAAPTDFGPNPLIVVGVDGSSVSMDALDWAVEEGTRRRATVRVVHAYHDPNFHSYADAALDEAARVAAAQQILDAAVEHAESVGKGVRIEAILTPDHPARALVDASRNAELLVLGASSSGALLSTLLGSVGEKVFHHATCPVVSMPRRPLASTTNTP